MTHKYIGPEEFHSSISVEGIVFFLFLSYSFAAMWLRNSFELFFRVGMDAGKDWGH
jgi:hypothetical protein